MLGAQAFTKGRPKARDLGVPSAAIHPAPLVSLDLSASYLLRIFELYSPCFLRECSQGRTALMFNRRSCESLLLERRLIDLH